GPELLVRARAILRVRVPPGLPPALPSVLPGGPVVLLVGRLGALVRPVGHGHAHALQVAPAAGLRRALEVRSGLRAGSDPAGASGVPERRAPRAQRLVPDPGGTEFRCPRRRNRRRASAA